MLSETKVSLYSVENPPAIKTDDSVPMNLRPFLSNTCVLGGIVYFSYKGTLYFIDLSKGNLAQLSWQKDPLMPFGRRIGQSMTTSNQSIVFFGGHDDSGIYYNDLWMYNTDSKLWTYVTTNVHQRAFHASAGNGNSCLIISGGKFKETIFDDIYLINLKTSVTTKIDIGVNLKFFNHSLIQLPNSQFCLIGGYDEQSKVNNKIKLIDLENKREEILNTEYDNLDVISPNVTFSYDLLMVAGSKNEEKFISSLMMFSFENKIWIPLNLIKYQSFIPLIGFSIKNYYGSILLLNEELSQIAIYYIFDGNKTPKFSRDNPEYIDFLERNLYDGLKVFKNLSSPFKQQIHVEQLKLETNMNEISKLIKDNKLLTEDKIKPILQSEKDNNTLRKIVQYTNIITSIVNNNKNTKLSKNKENNETDIKLLINKIFEQKKLYTKTKEELEAKAYSLSNRIEILTLYEQTFNNDTKIEEDNNLIYTSLQIADKIKILQNKIKKLRGQYKEEYQKYQNIKNSTLSNYIQFDNIYRNKKQLNSKLNEAKSNYYKSFSNLFDERFKVLSEFSSNDKICNIVKNYVLLSENKSNIESILNGKNACLNKLKESVELLSNVSIGFEATPINNILIGLEEIKNWSAQAINSLPPQKYQPLTYKVRRPTSVLLGENYKIKINSKKPTKISSFKDNVEQWESFANDIEKILKMISNELDQNYE